MKLKNISWKILLLPLSFIYPSLIFFKTFQHEIYYFISFFISGLIMTWNFPSLASALSSRPIYYDDLSIDDNIRNERKILVNIESTKKFQNIYIFVQQFILSIALALIFDYGFIQFKNKNMELLQILIAIGGLASIYTKIVYYLGKIIIIILYQWKNKEREIILNNYNDY